MSSFSRTVDVVYNAMRDNDFLIIGRRWHVMLTRPWDFSKPDWERQLESYAETHGFLDRITGIDYFIFPKDLFETMPPLALGRCWHDAWIIYHAKRFKIPVVDATQANMIIHQRHDFSYVPFNKKGIINMKSPEIVENQKLCKGGCRFYNVLDATLILLKGALRKPSIFRIAARVFVFSTRYSWYIVAEVYHPYFFPIVALWRGMKYCVNKTASLTGKS
jgi:hypothetical protein